MNRILLLAAMMSTSGWAAATYTLSASNFTTLNNFASCGTGPCANYTSAMKISGSFPTATALPANFSGATDITSQVTAYSFTDGINTYTNTDSNSRVYQMNVATDGSGQITVASILIEKWLTGSSPHAVGNRVSFINLNGPTINQADQNYSCATVGGGTGSGVTDLCVTATNDSSSSSASENTASSWSTPVNTPPPAAPPATPIPSSIWLLLAGLAVFGWMQRAVIFKNAR